MTILTHGRTRTWKAAVCGLALASAVSLAGCAPPVTATQSKGSGLPTPVSPAVLATLPPAKPAHPPDNIGGPSVSIENFNYVAADLTVKSGSTIVWINHDDVDHTVTASDNGFTSVAIQTDGQFSHTFSTPGTYSYFCAIHPFMTGKVIVQ